MLRRFYEVVYGFFSTGDKKSSTFFSAILIFFHTNLTFLVNSVSIFHFIREMYFATQNLAYTIPKIKTNTLKPDLSF